MLGRGLRIMPGKQDCLVLDFTDKYHQVWAVCGDQRPITCKSSSCLVSSILLSRLLHSTGAEQPCEGIINHLSIAGQPA
jgi:hypothetical protein